MIMAIPASFTTSTVTDTLYEIDGAPAAGTVEFRPNVGQLVSDQGFTVLGSALSVTVPVAAGTFSVDLPATDVDGITPVSPSWGWDVVLATASGRKRWTKLVPVSAVDLRLTELADWAPVPFCVPHNTPWHAGYACGCWAAAPPWWTRP